MTNPEPPCRILCWLVSTVKRGARVSNTSVFSRYATLPFHQLRQEWSHAATRNSASPSESPSFFVSIVTLNGTPLPASEACPWPAPMVFSSRTVSLPSLIRPTHSLRTPLRLSSISPETFVTAPSTLASRSRWICGAVPSYFSQKNQPPAPTITRQHYQQKAFEIFALVFAFKTLCHSLPSILP